MSIEASPLTWKQEVVIDGHPWELWTCGHWHPLSNVKYPDPCRFCWPHGLPNVWETDSPYPEVQAEIDRRQAVYAAFRAPEDGDG